MTATEADEAAEKVGLFCTMILPTTATSGPVYAAIRGAKSKVLPKAVSAATGATTEAGGLTGNGNKSSCESGN